MSITRRNKGRWCFRARIWYPESRLGDKASDHASIQVEGPIEEWRGELLIQLLVNGYWAINEKEITELKKLTERMRIRSHRKENR